MSRFAEVPRLPRIPKYEFRERFDADPRPDKMLVSTGAYKNEKGELPRFDCVRIATDRIRKREMSKYYLDVTGYEPFTQAVNRFLFGESSSILLHDRVITAHTPGGTVALRLGADFIRSQWPDVSIWVSDPTWGNHIRVFQTAGLSVKEYRYYDAATKDLDFDGLMATVRKIPNGDVLFLQASAHNPTCIDLKPEQWRQLAGVAADKRLLPFFDVAFFGFSKGMREDLEGLMIFCEQVDDLLIALSFSKSFALYNDRIGAFSIVSSSREDALNVNSHIRPLIRANYSNPPLEGAAVVTAILDDPELTEMWKRDITAIRERIQATRKRLHEGLMSHGVRKDLSHLLRERGLFTTLDLSPEEIDRLRVDHGIHISSAGRINVTSMRDEQVDRFCEIASPLIG
jgi:aspartate/tyrosine/aromatic aminotransferase